MADQTTNLSLLLRQLQESTGNASPAPQSVSTDQSSNLVSSIQHTWAACAGAVQSATEQDDERARLASEYVRHCYAAGDALKTCRNAAASLGPLTSINPADLAAWTPDQAHSLRGLMAAVDPSQIVQSRWDDYGDCHNDFVRSSTRALQAACRLAELSRTRTGATFDYANRTLLKTVGEKQAITAQLKIDLETFLSGQSTQESVFARLQPINQDATAGIVKLGENFAKLYGMTLPENPWAPRGAQA